VEVISVREFTAPNLNRYRGNTRLLPWRRYCYNTLTIPGRLSSWSAFCAVTAFLPSAALLSRCCQPPSPSPKLHLSLSLSFPTIKKHHSPSPCLFCNCYPYYTSHITLFIGSSPASVRNVKSSVVEPTRLDFIAGGELSLKVRSSPGFSSSTPFLRRCGTLQPPVGAIDGAL
jgi:hypothetical protein